MATFIVQAISTSRAVAASDNHDNILLQKSVEKKILKSYTALCLLGLTPVRLFQACS